MWRNRGVFYCCHLPVAICLLTCLVFFSPPPLPAAAIFERVAPHNTPPLFDDLSRNSLKAAVRSSLTVLQTKSPTQTLAFGGKRVSVATVQDSLKRFYLLLDTEENLQAAVLRDFDVYRVTSPVLFTGYHEPVLKGNLVRTAKYRYPIYRRPDDLIEISTVSRNGKKRAMRRVKGKLVPYFGRSAIDGTKVLAGKNYEIAWVDDPVALFFLHIQGSGQVELPDGSRLRVSYAGSNGRPYRSIGKLMLKQGRLDPGKASAPDIQQYLYAHPEEREDIFFHNQRYIFFQRSSGNPRGSLGAPLTPGRSIATDPQVYPPGALGFIRTKQPILTSHKKISWKNFSRFVLLQDSGAAITGPSRADLFWGSGAQVEAGYMAQNGELYLLLKKR